MPSTFTFQPYDYGGSSIGALMMAPAQARARALREAGAAQARAAEIGGQAWGGAANTIGSLIQNGLQQYQQQKAEAPRREMEGLQLTIARDQVAGAKAEADAERRRDAAFMDLMSREEAPDPREILTIYGPERGSKIAQGLEAFGKIQQGRVSDARTEAGRLAAGFLQFSPDMQQRLWPTIRSAAINGGLGDEQSIPTEATPEFLNGVMAWAKGEGPGAPKTREVKVTNPDGSETIQIVPDTPGQTFTSAPKREKVTYSAPTPAMVNGRREFIRAGSDGAMYDSSGRKLPDGAARPIEPQGPSAAAEPLHAVIGPDGRPILVPRSQAVGRMPASNREQGRPVTSGDAGRLAELDTSLDDLKVLGGALGSEGGTGTLSRVGAALPNAVTEVTGWGQSAKQRQAVIDRVKQVIGKALEGGVLRKEDEEKYKKILPTIGDTPAVAAQKLRGLEEAIRLRKDRLVDSFEDAGYDVGRYRGRNAPNVNRPADLVWDPATQTFKRGGGD